MSKELTVMDYLRSLFRHGERIDLDLYFSETSETSSIYEIQELRIEPAENRKKFLPSGLLLLIGLLFAIGGQYFLELQTRKVIPAVIMYAISLSLVIAAIFNSKEKTEFREQKNILLGNFSIKPAYFAAGILFLVAAFFLFGGNLFTFANVALWITGMGLTVYSLWQAEEKQSDRRSKNWIFLGAIILVAIVTFFFRYYRLSSVPGEMFSDHAEKLYDIMDVLAGKTSIFFIRNTGREPLQFYLSAAIIKIFHTGISFLSLKLGTVTVGFVTLLFIYFLGRELIGKWVGLSAAFFAGIAYWPNVISRVGLRFPFYPLFVAPVLFYLIKGLRERRMNLMILAGIFLGIGLHGYSPIRVLPFLVTIIFLFYAISHKERQDKQFALTGFLVVAFLSLAVFLPLFRYLLDNPAAFSYRMASRMTSLENPINGPVVWIFLRNLWNALIMFFYSNGVVWVSSIPYRPALDIFSAALFFIGLVKLGFDIFTGDRDKWREYSILISIPILMLPSILSLAFPGENPSLNRSGGAIVPVFFICAYGFITIAREITQLKNNLVMKITGFVVLGALVLGSTAMNFDLVFNQYSEQFLQNAWNSSDMGAQIAEFVGEGNSPRNAFVVPYPYWVDTRLVGIEAGFPGIDYALWPDDFPMTKVISGEKLFILKPEDQISIDKIKSLYPDAQEEIFYSRTPGKDFIKVYVGQ